MEFLHTALYFLLHVSTELKLSLTMPPFNDSVCVAAIVRIFFINTINWYDATYTFVNLGVWLNVECNVGIVSACLPIFPPLVTSAKKLRSHFSSLGSSSSHSTMVSTGSRPANDWVERGRPLVRREERIGSAQKGSERSSFALHTPNSVSSTGNGGYNESEKVKVRDELFEA